MASCSNGSAAAPSALIWGYDGVAARGMTTVRNFATIAGAGEGVRLQAGGTVVNGAATDFAAAIEGHEGVAVAGGAGSVTNFGVIGGALSYVGVALGAGGQVVNGGTADTGAIIAGSYGVIAYGRGGALSTSPPSSRTAKRLARTASACRLAAP